MRMSIEDLKEKVRKQLRKMYLMGLQAADGNQNRSS